MRRFILERSNDEIYTSHSGLARVGLCLNRYADVDKTLREAIPLCHGASPGDRVKAYVGQLCLGKSAFEAIEGFRRDGFFKRSPGIRKVPSTPRLRFDEYAEEMLPMVYANTIDFLPNAKVPVSLLATGHVALDIERLPSGEPAANGLIMSLAAYSYKILRWIGLLAEISPVRHAVKRRRLRPVIQELMYRVARVIRCGRRWTLRFSAHCPACRALRIPYHTNRTFMQLFSLETTPPPSVAVLVPPVQDNLWPLAS